MNDFKLTKGDSFVIIITIFLFLFFLRSLKLGIWNFGDLTRFSTLHSVINPLFIWNDSGLGHLNLGNFWYLLIIYIFNFIFSKSAHLFFYIPLLPLSLLTFYYISRHHGFNKGVSILGSVLYSINPISISLFIGGEGGLLLAYAIQPLIFLFVYKIVVLNDTRLSSYLYFGLLLILLFNNNIHTALFSFLMILLFNFFIFIYTKKKITLDLFKILFLFLLIFFIFLLPNIISQFIIYQKISISDEITISGYSYQDISLLNLIRLAGNKGSAQASSFLDYNTLSSTTFIGYLIILIIIFLPLFFKDKIFKKNKKIEYLFSLLIIIFLFLIMVLIKNNPSLLNLNPLASAFRNPMKFMYPLSFFIALSFTYGINCIRNIVSIKRYLFLFILISLGIIYYNYSAMDGSLGLQKVRVDYLLHDNVFDIYEPNKQIFVNKDYRIIFIPWDYNIQKDVLWLTKNYFNPISGSSIYGTNSRIYKQIFENIMYSDDISDSIKILSQMNVKYIFLFKNPRQIYDFEAKDFEPYDCFIFSESQTWRINCNPEFISNRIVELENENLQTLKKIYDDDNFVIFEILDAKLKFYSYPYNLSDKNLISNIEYDNLIKNPSFEEEFRYWYAWPVETMDFSNDSIKGKKSLLINSKRDSFSSIFQNIEITRNVPYVLRFNFKVNDTTEDYLIKLLWFDQENDLSESSSFKKDFIRLYEMNNLKDAWNSFETDINPPKNAKNLRVNVLVKNGYFSLDNMYLGQLKTSLNDSINIVYNIEDYEKISPTKYKIKINATQPFTLVFVESYDLSWVAKVNEKTYESSSFYDTINSFNINETGTFEVVVEYQNQKKFYSVLILNSLTFVILITFIIIRFNRKK